MDKSIPVCYESAPALASSHGVVPRTQNSGLADVNRWIPCSFLQGYGPSTKRSPVERQVLMKAVAFKPKPQGLLPRVV